MGCYMSVPDNRVYVTEGKGKNFIYATASCQGWRREQEDAEECLPFFDEDASLFILCDGHGGAEVAKYTVKHFPDFLKNHPLYKEGKYEAALEKAFIDFDVLLRTDEVMEELLRISVDDDDDQNSKKDEESQGKDSMVLDLKDSNEISAEASHGPGGSSAGTSSTSNNGSSSVVEDVDTETLRREAKVPLKELLDEYSAASGVDPAKRHKLLNKYNSSPVIRPKKDDDENDETEGAGKTSIEGSTEAGPSTSKTGDDEEASGSGGPLVIKEALIEQALKRYFSSQISEEDTSDDSEFECEETSSNDDDDDDGDDEDDDETGQGSSKNKRKKKHKRPAGDQLENSTSEDSDDDDDGDDDDEDEEEDDEEEDENEEVEQESDEEVDEEKNNDWELEYDGNENEDDEGRGDNEDQWQDIQDIVRPPQRQHKPGMDSGCTVVVALIKDKNLYVASAGDSRCIMIMRNGECKPMSFDHKPEDSKERKRIMNAGGRVTDGRVNGGLNLSRAFGDFTYKGAKLDPKDQMITPCPDVKVASLETYDVEYIFLACDGIWNSMKNIQASRFIQNHTRLQPSCHNLIEICVSLFRNCIAPKTDGDGTGCDNMTCIIARFGSPNGNLTNSDLKVEEELPESLTSSSCKRSNSSEHQNLPNTKRRCFRL